jgi:ribosomal small subunit protein bTHX
MGRGDKKSKKGKITKGSYGIARNRKGIKAKLKRTASKKSATPAEGATKQKRTIKKKAEA